MTHDSETPAPGPRFEIDRRPLGWVVLTRLKRQVLLLFLFTSFLWMRSLTPPEGLDQTSWSALSIFSLCGALWATGALPPAITSLLAMALIPMFGVMSAGETYAFFGSKVVFFILGAFMLSAAMMATGLSRRIASVFVRRFGATPRKLVLAVFLLCASASTLMSGHAVAAMVFPIVTDLARSLKLEKGRSQMGRALFFAMAWGCIIGGSLTVLGGGRGPLAIGLLEEATGEAFTITFAGFMAYSWPLVLAMLVFAAWQLRVRFQPEVESTRAALEALEEQIHEMGKLSPRELVVGVVLVVTVGLWAFAGDSLGLANIAIVSMGALFSLGALQWREIEAHVNWGIVVMYGGAIGLGSVMERSGAAQWLTDQVLSGTSMGPGGLMMGLAIASAILTEFMSNSAVVAMLMPPALAFAESQGVNLAAITMVVVLPSNFAYIFPIATPVTALAWSSGYLESRAVARNGLLLHGVSWTLMAGLIFLYWPAVDLL
jgi:sodium-dependent dicarboxylate transporter 2/3/5